jgi:hypothetical protein
MKMIITEIAEKAKAVVNNETTTVGKKEKRD